MQQAEEALRIAIEAAGKPVSAKPSPKTFREMFAEWMRDHVERECAPTTQEAYAQQGAYLLRRIGDRPLHELDRNLLEDTMREIADRGGQRGRKLARKTVRHIGFVMRGCLSYAIHRRELDSHPMQGMKLPKLEKRPRPKVLENDDFERVVERASGTRLFPLIVVAEATGLRRGELLAATWRDLDFRTGLLMVNKSLEQTKKYGLQIKSTKSGEPREIPLPDYALQVLEDWKAEQDHDRSLYGADYRDHGLIFCRPDGEYYSPSQVSARVVELMRKTGIRRTLHSLRHTHASGMLSSKRVPIATVSERLGHANSAVTLAIYTHALKSDKQVAAEVWNEARSGVVLSNVINKRRKKLQVIEKKTA